MIVAGTGSRSLALAAPDIRSAALDSLTALIGQLAELQPVVIRSGGAEGCNCCADSALWRSSVHYGCHMNLAEWAEANGVARVTAYRWFKAGKLPVPARKVGGLILVDDVPGVMERRLTVIYARVSSADQRHDLDRQVARVAGWATRQAMSVDRVVTEVGSALNGHRRKFLGLLRDETVGQIVVEHRDRFCRFGAEYVEAALAAQGRELIVVDPAEVDDDLVRDVTELLTSMCARLYGRDAAENRAARLAAAVTEPDVEMG